MVCKLVLKPAVLRGQLGSHEFPPRLFLETYFKTSKTGGPDGKDSADCQNTGCGRVNLPAGAWGATPSNSGVCPGTTQ